MCLCVCVFPLLFVSVGRTRFPEASLSVRACLQVGGVGDDRGSELNSGSAEVLTETTGARIQLGLPQRGQVIVSGARHSSSFCTSGERESD